MHATRGARPLGALALLVVAATTFASEGTASPGPVLVGVTSGSRLRARLYDGGDGALFFLGWFDTELGFPCIFTRSRGGPMRCMPTGQPAVYLDSTCTTPVWGGACPATPPPPYVTALVPGAGVAYALGEPYAGAVHNTMNGGYCYDYVKSKPLSSFYGMGAEIPSERLVAGAVDNVPVGYGALNFHTNQGDDGSSSITIEVGKPFVGVPLEYAFPSGTLVYSGSGRLRVARYARDGHNIQVSPFDGPLFDTQADSFCRPEQFADGLRCVPRNVVPVPETGPYGDAGCTTLLSETRPGSSRLRAPPASGSLGVGRSCSGSTAYMLGDVVTPAVVYFKGSTCEQKAPTAGAVYRTTTRAQDTQWAVVKERTE
jgi:hypothetical protein